MPFTPYQPVLDRGAHGNAHLGFVGSVSWRNGLLVRATNWLGDALMTLPAVHKVVRMMPDACGVFVLCPASLAPLWDAVPWVSKSIPMEGKRLRAEEAREAAGCRPGAALVLPNSFGSALDVFRCSVPVRVGRRGNLRSPLLTHCLPRWRRGAGFASRHQLSEYLELAEAFGVVAWDAECPALSPADAEATAKRLGISAEEHWLALAPGAAYGPAKQWPVKHVAEVARWWTKHHGRVVVLGVASDAAAGEVVCKAADGALNLAGKTNLGELMAVLAGVELVVANDSGAMHLAAALGTPGVAMFGSTDPVATGPLGAPWTVLHNPPECAPCFERHCPRDDQPGICLECISPENVQEAVLELKAYVG